MSPFGRTAIKLPSKLLSFGKTAERIEVAAPFPNGVIPQTRAVHRAPSKLRITIQQVKITPACIPHSSRVKHYSRKRLSAHDTGRPGRIQPAFAGRLRDRPMPKNSTGPVHTYTHPHKPTTASVRFAARLMANIWGLLAARFPSTITHHPSTPDPNPLHRQQLSQPPRRGHPARGTGRCRHRGQCGIQPHRHSSSDGH